MDPQDYCFTEQYQRWKWTDWEQHQGKQEETLDASIRQSFEEASCFKRSERLVLDRTELRWEKWKAMPLTMAQPPAWGRHQKLVEHVGRMDPHSGSPRAREQVVDHLQIFTRETWQHCQKSLELQDAPQEITPAQQRSGNAREDRLVHTKPHRGDPPSHRLNSSVGVIALVARAN